MATSRPPYSPEFHRQMVDLVHAGRDPDELARGVWPPAASQVHALHWQSTRLNPPLASSRKSSIH